MNCDEVLQQLSEFLDEEAKEELCQAIEAHLQRCRDCRIEVDTVRKTIVLHQAERDDMPIPAAVSASLQAALAKEYERGDEGAR